MTKITFMGAGSHVFATNVLGDCIMSREIEDLHIYLYDIDPQRLEDSRRIMETMKRNMKREDVTIVATMDRLEALRGAGYVVNAIQVGGYDPATIADFEIPKKYGLRQTIADTLGIGGIFRAMRTIPAVEAFAADMEQVCPDALFLNYTNPCAMVAGYLQQYTNIHTVGLCHSVPNCHHSILVPMGLMKENEWNQCKWEIAGINHQAWLLKIEDLDGNDLYPEIKRRSKAMKAGEMKPFHDFYYKDLVRHEMMHRFGYYNTESSEHTAEYLPWFIKSKYPELIEKFNIPLDEYIRRCIAGIEDWDRMRRELVDNPDFDFKGSGEYAAKIIKAKITDVPFQFHGNVANNGLITNLPRKACVEVLCVANRTGIHPTIVGDLPEQCAAINRTNINVQLLTLEGMKRREKDYIYMAAMMDPHTGSELSMDEIVSMCDELFEAHKQWLPEYK